MSQMNKKDKPVELDPIDYDTSDEAMQKMQEHFDNIDVGHVSEVESPAADAVLRFFGKVKNFFTKED